MSSVRRECVCVCDENYTYLYPYTHTHTYILNINLFSLGNEFRVIFISLQPFLLYYKCSTMNIYDFQHLLLLLLSLSFFFKTTKRQGLWQRATQLSMHQIRVCLLNAPTSFRRQVTWWFPISPWVKGRLLGVCSLPVVPQGTEAPCAYPSPPCSVASQARREIVSEEQSSLRKFRQDSNSMGGTGAQSQYADIPKVLSARGQDGDRRTKWATGLGEQDRVATVVRRGSVWWLQAKRADCRYPLTQIERSW